MVDEIVTRQELIDAKRDARDLGKGVNEKVIVSPRYGEDFKSLPMIAAEFQISSDAAEAAAVTAAESANIAQSSANIAEAAATAATIGAGVFETPEAGVDPVTGVADGAYFNVRSPNNDSYLDEYQNVGGVPTPSGKSYPSGAALTDVKEAIIDPVTGNATAAKVIDESIGKSVEQINAVQKANLKLFGANVGGGGDDSQAFIDAGALDQNYFIPGGTYRVDSSKVNINLHNFTAADKVTIYVDGVEKDYSGAFNGPFRSNTNGVSYFWYNAKTGKTLVRWSDGASASDSHQFYLPLEVRANGHGFMLRQQTRGAGIDILYQDELSDDLFYLAVNGTTDNCSFDISYDSTPKVDGQGGGAGGFESAMQIQNVLGTARLIFKSAPLEINQSLNFKRRSGATRNYQLVSNTLAGLDLKVQDASSGSDIATLMNFRENQVTAGLHTTFVGAYTQTASQRRAFSVIDGGNIANTAKKTYPITTGVGDRAVGEFTVIYVGSDGNIFTRTARFKANGSTVVFEESALNDVLPAALIANVVYESGGLNLVLHNNGYSSSMRFTVKLDWVQTYY